MSGDDWQDGHLRVIGMFVSGDPLRSPGPRGEQQRDRSFMLWLNGSPDDCEITFPSNEWVQRGRGRALHRPRQPPGLEVSAGETVTLAARSLVLLEQI